MAVQDQEVIEVLEAVRRRVRERYAEEKTDTLSRDELIASEIQAAIQDVNAHARVNSHLPLLWEDMVIGRLRAFVQRVVRRLLRWYINPIVDQQNTFNAATAKALTLLTAENVRLRGQQAELTERLSSLEAQLARDRSK